MLAPNEARPNLPFLGDPHQTGHVMTMIMNIVNMKSTTLCAKCAFDFVVMCTLGAGEASPESKGSTLVAAALDALR